MIKKGDKVAIEYEGNFEDGTVFDSSNHGDHSHPLVFVVGSGQVIPGFENATINMKENEEKQVEIMPSEGYGDYDARLVQVVPLKEMNVPHESLQPGTALMMQTPEGHRVPIFVKAVDKENITLDMNHPLAGKKLIFKIKVVGINDSVKVQEHHH